MAKSKPSDLSMVFTCNDVTNDQFKRSGKTFINVKDGSGSCSCIVNNNKTGKSTKTIPVGSVLLAERTKRK